MASKVKYQLNLRGIFNRAFSDKSAGVRRQLLPIISRPEFKRVVGQRVINEIVKRTTELNIDKNDIPFTGYSTSYKESDNFAIYGKNEGKVDLKLTGEMHSSMVSVEKFGANIQIEFVDQFNNDKAHGHINGTRTKAGKKLLPIRDFFGLPKEAEEAIIKQTVLDQSGGAGEFDVDLLLSQLQVFSSSSSFSSPLVVATEATFSDVLSEGLSGN